MSRKQADGRTPLSFEGNPTAWGIREVYTDFDGKVYESILGIYYFGWAKNEAHNRPRYCASTTAMFRTRDIARQELKRVRNGQSIRARRSVVKISAYIEYKPA